MPILVGFGKPCPHTCVCGVPKRPKRQTEVRRRDVRMSKKSFDFLDKLSGPAKMSSTCSDPAFSTNAPAFVRHGSLRPASRDLSGDARSGNANQTVFEPGRTRIQKQPIRQDFLSPPDPRSIPGRLGREWISNGSGLERRCQNSSTWKPPDKIFSSRCIRTGAGPKPCAICIFLKG